MTHIIQHTVKNWQINFFLDNECEFIDTRDNYKVSCKYQDSKLLLEHLHHIPENVRAEAKKVFVMYDNVRFITEHPFEFFLLMINSPDVKHDIYKTDIEVTNNFYKILEELFLSNKDNKNLSPEELFVPLLLIIYNNPEFVRHMNSLLSFYREYRKDVENA